MPFTRYSGAQQMLLHSSQHLSSGSWQYCQVVQTGTPSQATLPPWVVIVCVNRFILASLNRPVTCNWAASLLACVCPWCKSGTLRPAWSLLSTSICCLNATVLLQDGLSLEGLEGEVLEVVKEYQGKNLTANLPYKVQLLLENDGKKTKFFAHLVSPCSPVHAICLTQCWPEFLQFLCRPRPDPAPVAVS